MNGMRKTMSRSGGRILAAVVLVGAGATQEVAAQQRLSFEGQGGIAMPTGRLADVVDAGPAVGLQMAYNVSPRVALNVDGNVDLMGGDLLTAGGRAPDMRLWRYGVGVSADLLPSERWALLPSLGLGATRFASDGFTAPGSTDRRSFRHTYLASNGGLKLGYSMGRRVTTYVGARGVHTWMDDEDTGVLASLDPTRIEPFSSSWTVPVSLGLSIRTGGGRQAAPAPARSASAPPRSVGPDDRERREREARRLCEQAESALQAGDYARARELYSRAKSEYPGTLCGDAADAQLAKVAAVETIRERVHFEYDRHRITDDAAVVLRRKAEMLRRHPDLRLTIEGHCDERGSLEYNQALGMRRAESTRQFLIALGLSADMFEITSFGKDRPIAPQSNERAWSMNRRSEFVIRNLGAL